jgi:energy-coupling factor transporter ATP-binding protein EcfA2
MQISTPQTLSRHRFTAQAVEVTRRVQDTLASLRLQPDLVDGCYLVETSDMVVLFLPLDTGRMNGNLEHYANAVGPIQTSVPGLPVSISKSSGFRYAIRLSKPKSLPRKAVLPHPDSGELHIGVQPGNVPLSVSWKELGHILVVGMTGSGKSTFLRSVAYQAIADHIRLLLGDRPLTTFPMLAGHPLLMAPIAKTPDDYLAILRKALAECARRETLFSQVGGFPEDLEEYNQIVHQGGYTQLFIPLPRLLVILDEYNATLNILGGHKSTFARLVNDLVYQGRKFGIQLIIASQEFSKDALGNMRDQMGAVIAFRVKNSQVARNVGVKAALQIPHSRVGLAVTDRWGVVQAYYLDKERLIRDAHTPLALIKDEALSTARRALNEHEGRMSIPILMGWGMAERAARKLVEGWEIKGWLQKDPIRYNARYLTPAFCEMLEVAESNRQSGQSGQSASNPGQTDKNEGVGGGQA